MHNLDVNLLQVAATPTGAKVSVPLIDYSLPFYCRTLYQMPTDLSQNVFHNLKSYTFKNVFNFLFFADIFSLEFTLESWIPQSWNAVGLYRKSFLK